jgi:DNA-binding SARP family transcriptional activator
MSTAQILDACTHGEGFFLEGDACRACAERAIEAARREEREAAISHLTQLKTAIAWVPGVSPGPVAALINEVERVIVAIRDGKPAPATAEVLAAVFGARGGR